MADAEAFHAVAQELAIAIVGHLAEDAGIEAEHSRPSEMIEDHAADGGLFDCDAMLARIEDHFFVGAE